MAEKRSFWRRVVLAAFDLDPEGSPQAWERQDAAQELSDRLEALEARVKEMADVWDDQVASQVRKINSAIGGLVRSQAADRKAQLDAMADPTLGQIRPPTEAPELTEDQVAAARWAEKARHLNQGRR